MTGVNDESRVDTLYKRNRAAVGGATQEKARWRRLGAYERAREAFYDAVSIARQYGHPKIEPEHLLLAILRQQDGVAYRIVAQFAEVGAMLLELEEYLSGASAGTVEGELELSERSRTAVLLALKQAVVSSEKWVGTHHLLYGIVSEPRSFAAQLLIGRGLSPDRVIHALS